MANIAEFLIKLKTVNAECLSKVEATLSASKTASDKFKVSASAIPKSIEEIRSKISQLQHERGFAKSEHAIRRFNGEIKVSQKELQRLENLPPRKFLGNISDAVHRITGLNLAAVGTAVAFRKLSNFVSESTKLYDIQVQAEAQLRASLESTNGAVGRSFNEIVKQASDLQKKTLFGDEVIIKAQSVLLTFKDIRGEINTKAIPAILDLATKMGGDLQGATVQVGKALNDPILGISALRRTGIQLTDEQTENIKKLVEEGKKEEAQLMILSELQSQFGGSAEAAAKAGLGPMQQLTNLWNDFKEKIGGAAINIANRIVPSLKSTVIWLSEHGRFLKNTAKLVVTLGTAWASYKITVAACNTASAVQIAWLRAKRVALLALNGRIRTATKAMQMFNMVTKMNPLGLAIGAITAAASAFMLFRKRTKEATDTMKEARETYSSFYAQERSQLDAIFAKLRQTNPKSEERKRLVKELAELYPELNKQTLDDITNTNNLSGAYETLLQKIKTTAMVRAKEKTIESLYSDKDYQEFEDKLLHIAASKVGTMKTKDWDEKSNKLLPERNMTISEIYDNLKAKALRGGPIDYKDDFGNDAYYTLSNKNRKNFSEINSKVDDALKSIGTATEISGTSGTTSGSNNSNTSTSTASDSITGGGKQVKNFYINIDSLIKENTNMFQSSKDDPRSAQDFMGMLSEALQTVVNDVNYAA